ncbi:glycosyltransferase family 4 protein [Aestuariivivens sediminis]|uniref:glycosyltransferase family 4 protein n=1 Tax=Aestuariivivens sediminis TaxID=2913557 RepID=UPI001F5ADD9C|nr:glycosyltransferase family 4 protein [Aestuariivivens sediminis]
MKKLLILGQIPKEYGGRYTTGVANVIMELSHCLKKDFEIYIYATNFKSYTIKNIDGIQILGVSYRKILKLVLIEVFKSPWQLIRRFKDNKKKYGVSNLKTLLHFLNLKAYLNKIKPEIVNAHGIIFAPVLKNFDINKNVIYSFHGLMYDDPNSILANKTRGIEIGKLYRESSKFIHRAIFLNEEMKIKGERSLRIEAAKSEVIYNGVNTKKFKFCENSRLEIRKLFGLEETITVFISVGALTHRKNHIGFIEFLLRNNFSGVYWIIGKFEAEETKNKIIEYKDKIKQFKIEIINYVPHNELFKYYSAADLYAHPSTSEGQALVVFEALCCGLPVLVNEEIKSTVSLGKAYTGIVRFVNLKKSFLRQEKQIINRKILSKKCKKDFNWGISAKKYKKVFLDEFN